MVKPFCSNAVLQKRGLPQVEDSLSPAQLLKRPELHYGDIESMEGSPSPLPETIRNQVEIQLKYEGYLKRQEAEVKKFKRLEDIVIPLDFDYSSISGLSNELRRKLSDIQPSSLGQASRIEGMTPAALSVLMRYLKRTP